MFKSWRWAIVMVTLAIGCDRPENPDVATALDPSLSIEMTEPSVVVLGRGRYTVSGIDRAVTGRELAGALQTMANRNAQHRRIVLYVPAGLDPDAKGFNITLALNQASIAGFDEAIGYDGYRPNASPSERAQWTRLPPVDLRARRSRLLQEQRTDSATAH